MTTTTSPQSRNGVDVATLFATLDAVKENPEIAKFQFRVRNEWQGGTHSRVGVRRLLRRDAGDAAQERDRRRERPPGGARRHRPRADPGRVPPARDRRLPDLRHRATSPPPAASPSRGSAPRVEGDIDLLGILGLSDQVRNGYQQIKVTFHIEGDADDDTLREIVEQSRRRSAVYDALTNPSPVQIEVVTG